MSDSNPIPEDVQPVKEDPPGVLIEDAAPSSTEPPAEVPVAPPKLEARVTKEGVVLSKCDYSPEGVLLRVLEE